MAGALTGTGTTWSIVPTDLETADALRRVIAERESYLQDARDAYPDPFAGLDVPFTDMEGVR